MAIGTIGKYERLDVLGHGTSGVVYLAWDTLLRRQVALKEIRAAGPEMERVLDEARVLDRLGRHPHIVRINSVDQENGVILIDMELVRGGTLSDLLRERGGKPLPTAEALRIVRAVLDALAYAHERRIIHRDVKPANILIGQDNVVKLTDFGLAEALGTGSVAGGGGTYPYMAPEDFAEDAASDYRSDLWAVGVVLYEMLTGRRPFAVGARIKDPFAWKRVIQEEEPPSLASLRPDLPVALNDVLRRALSKDKNARYPSARAFADALGTVEIPTDAVGASEARHEAMPALAVAVSAPPGASDTANIVPFVFAGGATVAYTLDELLVASAKHWDEARRALLEGRIERFLRAIGEVYIADLAGELRARGGDADRRLREFLERSQPEEEPDDATIAFVGAAATVPAAPTRDVPLLRRPRRLLARRARDITPPESFPAPQAPAAVPSPVATEAAPPAPSDPGRMGVPRWWFWPLFLLCVGPLATAVAASGHMRPERMGQYADVLEAWAIMGVLQAMLLIVGAGARFPLVARLACCLPIAGGVIAAGALVSQTLGARPSPDTLVRVCIVLLLPLVILLAQAATVARLWRLWAWLLFLSALAATLHYAR